LLEARAAFERAMARGNEDGAAAALDTLARLGCGRIATCAEHPAVASFQDVPPPMRRTRRCRTFRVTRGRLVEG